MNSSKVMRSRLVIPINVDKFIQKAVERNADLIVLDLEDSIPETQKDEARLRIPEAINQLSFNITPVYIRVNADKDLLYKDIEQAVMDGVAGIILPKAESEQVIQEVDEFITVLEKKKHLQVGTFKISLLIETAKGMQALNDVLKSSDRIDTVSIGMEDLSADMGFMINERTTDALNIFRMQLVTAAVANNVLPMGTMGSISNYTDLDKYRKHVREAFELGFVGTSCIHPNQVAILNEVFHYNDEELKEAKEIVDTFEKALEQGRASSSYKGQMIDYPHYAKYKQVVERNKDIIDYEHQKYKERERSL